MSKDERIKRIVVIVLLATASTYFLYSGFSLLYSEPTPVQKSSDDS